ncbi:hypothetical protein LCGC14_2768900, partial [marine sediment metagenome]
LQTGPLKNEYWSIADPSQVKTIPKWQGHQIVVDTTPDGITRLNVTLPSEKFNARIASPEDIGPAGRVTAANVRAKLDEFDQVVGSGTFPGPEAEGVVFKKPTRIGPIEEAVPGNMGRRMEEEAFSKFGAAVSPEDTVFILRDGRAVSGGKIEYPITDPSHDIVLTVIPEDIKARLLRTGDPGIDTLPFFMRETGAVRIRAQADELLVETIGSITPQQRIALDRLSARRSTFYVDVTSSPRGLSARPESVKLGSRREFLRFMDDLGEVSTEVAPIGLTTKEAKEFDRLQGIKGKLSNKQTARLSELEAKSIPLEPLAPNPFEIGGFSRAPTQMRGPRSVGGGPAPDDLGGFSRGGGGGRIGGGGVGEGGPPFEGSSGEEAIAKLTDLINQAKKPRRGQTLLQHEELQHRFKIVAERLKT